MIKSLAGVTIVMPDLDVGIASYRDWLGYVCAGIEPVGRLRAHGWGVQEVANARMAMLYPASGEDRFIRLVEGEPDPSYGPYLSLGWAAAEIIVQDVDALAVRLSAANSPFRTIGPPAVLDFEFTDQIKAMQVRGPGGEILYLTEVGAEIPGFDLPTAGSFVGQLFIMVLGARSIAEGASVYAKLGHPVGPDIRARIGVLSNAYGLSPDHRHILATVSLEDASLIEVDVLPTPPLPRALSSIGLPSGIAMVSFIGTPVNDGGAMLIGASGEWIEILPKS